MRSLPEKKKINIKRYVALAIAAPLIFGLIWIPLKTDLLKNVNYSSLNPFAPKGTAVYAPLSASEKFVPAKESSFVEEALIDINDTAHYKTFQITEGSNPVTAQINESEVRPDTTEVSLASVVTSFGNYHVVAGCFQVHSNAENFVRSLQEKNISAAIIGQNDKGLYVVSCGNFNTRKEALSGLDSLRKIQPEAWLYRN